MGETLAFALHKVRFGPQNPIWSPKPYQIPKYTGRNITRYGPKTKEKKNAGRKSKRKYRL